MNWLPVAAAVAAGVTVTVMAWFVQTTFRGDQIFRRLAPPAEGGEFQRAGSLAGSGGSEGAHPAITGAARFAGWDETALRAWWQRRWLFTLGVLFGGLLLIPISGFAPLALLMVPGMAGLAWLIPVKLLQRQSHRRQQQLVAGLPGFLDLMVLAGKAGLNIRQSLHLATTRTSGPLGDLLRRVAQRLELGVGLSRALGDELDGIQPGPVRLVLSALIKGEERGVSFTQTAMQQTGFVQQMRAHERQRAVDVLPLKLTLCGIAFLFPPVFVVVLVPNLLRFLDSGW